MNVSIDKQIQIDFKRDVRSKYNKIKGVYGNEVENAMKLYMTINGNSKYQNDPDVQALMNAKTNTQSAKNEKQSNIEQRQETIDERFEKINEKLDALTEKIETQTRRESSKKHGHAEFKKQFQMAFNEHHQVSRRDLEHFIMNHADIVDKRAIKSRIQYLLSHGMIESFAPDVYNIKIQ